MDARTAMIDAAEVLVAERSVGAVSLREVGAAAGQRNHSAAQYHFGSRHGLLRAVFERRMAPIDDDRRARLALAGDDPDLRALVEALVAPLVDAVTAEPTSHYARFLAQVLASDEVAGPDDRDAPFTAGYREVLTRLRAAIDGLPAAVRDQRTDHAVLLLVHGLARWERDRARGRSPVPPEVLHADLIDSIVGLLLAPSSVPHADRTAADPQESPC